MSNRKEGKRVSTKEALPYAIHAVTNLGMTVANVSKLLGINDRTLSGHIVGEKVKERAVEAGSKANLPNTTWKALNKLGGNIKVLTAAAEVCDKNNLPLKEINTFINNIKKENTEKTQLHRISKFYGVNGYTPISKHTRAAVSKPIRDGFFRKVRDLTLFLEKKKGLKSLQIAKGAEDHKRAKAAVKTLVSLLQKNVK